MTTESPREGMTLCPQPTGATRGSLRTQDSRSVDMITDKAQKSLPGTDQDDDPGEMVLGVRELVAPARGPEFKSPAT